MVPVTNDFFDALHQFITEQGFGPGNNYNVYTIPPYVKVSFDLELLQSLQKSGVILDGELNYSRYPDGKVVTTAKIWFPSAPKPIGSITFNFNLP